MNETTQDPLPLPLPSGAPPGYTIPQPPMPASNGALVPTSNAAPTPFNPMDPFRPAVVTPDGQIVQEGAPANGQVPATQDPDAATAERSARIAAFVAAGVGLLLLMAMFSKRKTK